MHQQTKSHIVIFEGNEHKRSTDPNFHNLSPLSISLLAGCHRASVAELQSLDPDLLLEIGADNDLLHNPEWLFGSPDKDTTPILALTRQYVQQSLQYLTYLEAEHAVSTNPMDIMRGATTIASSTGLLAAVAARTSSTIAEYLTRVVEFFRVAFWVGIRTTQKDFLAKGSVFNVLVEGISKSNLVRALDEFREGNPGVLTISAVLSEMSAVISGVEESVRMFSTILESARSCRVRYIPFNDALMRYGDIHGIKEVIVADIHRRKMPLPSLEDLRGSIYSCTGRLRISAERPDSLLTQILECLFSFPLDWPAAIHMAVSSLQIVEPVHAIGVGPGQELTRQVQHTLAARRIEVLTRSVAENTVDCLPQDNRTAIIGMALRMPGARDPEELWELIESGSSCLTKIPANRFPTQNYIGESSGARTLNLDTGNFLDDADMFDNELFKISPREARMMDPQQRLLLHVAYEALEDAGYIPHSSPSTNPDHFGVYIGAATNDYAQNVRDDVDIHYVSGTLSAFLSGRISYALSLGGPSTVFDTACSSSSVAIHAAVRALQAGDCTMALAGGVNVMTNPDLFIGLDVAHFLSRTGQSKPFDADADGYSRGEGCAIFVLKRMDAAVLDNDRILGVIRGAEVNQSYENSSITRTHSPTQAALLRRLLQKNGIRGEEIDLVEAHAAGTKQGDLSEMLAIHDTFCGNSGSREHPLYVSSIKASIGHLEAASGAASLAKVLLMLRHETIPRQIGIRTMNQVFETMGQLVIPMKSVPWRAQSGCRPRRAVINNYGAAGSNVSILLEDHAQIPRSGSHMDTLGSLVFGMSAPNQEALEKMKSRYVAWLEKASNQEISHLDFCFSSTARRRQHVYRVGFSTTAFDRQQFVERLTNAPAVRVRRGSKPRVIFVYTGHGSQHPGMAKTLYKTSPIFKAHIDICDAILTEHAFPTILPYLLDGSHVPVEELSVVEQTALLAFEVALSMLWRNWGINPVAVVGHSLGEYAALVASGILALKDALLLVGGRARLVEKHCVHNSTGMVSVALQQVALGNIIHSNPSFDDLVIACANSYDRHTVAGPIFQLEELKHHLESDHGIQAKFLPAQFAYHGPAMQPILEEYRGMLDRTVFMTPKLVCASTVTGMVLSTAKPVDSSHLLRHCHDMVRFTEAVDTLVVSLGRDTADLCWVEISPHRTLLPLIRTMHPSSPSTSFLDPLIRGVDPWETLTKNLAHLYTMDVEVNWNRVFSCLGKPKCISLPSYPFQSKPFWVPYRDPSLAAHPNPHVRGPRDILSPSPTISVHPPTNKPEDRVSFTLSETTVTTYSEAHLVASVPICPASILVDAILSGIFKACSGPEMEAPQHFAIQHLEFLQPLLPGGTGTVCTRRVTFSLSGEGYYDFALETRYPEASSPPCNVLYARGRCKVRTKLMPLGRPHDTNHILDRIRSLDPCLEKSLGVFSTKSIYEVVFPRVVQYSPHLYSLNRLVVSEDHSEGHAVMRLPTSTPCSESADEETVQSVVHPVYLDAMVHLPGFIINLHLLEDDLFVCAGIGMLELSPGAFAYDGSTCPEYRIHTTISPSTLDVSLANTVVVSSDPPAMVAVLKNIHFKRVRKDVFTRAFRQTEESGTSTPSMTSDRLCKLASSSSPTHSPTPLKCVLESTLHLPRGRARDDMTLEELGLDSLTSVEVLHLLQSQYNVRLPGGFFQEHPTVEAAEKALERVVRRSQSDVSADDCLQQLSSVTAQSNPRRATICFIHDGSGLVSCYKKLKGLGRDVWALKDPYMGSDGWGYH
ncbi:beta-ketoacyl synthase [Ephemerocybe angulata]|uniref:Beta-ketoacyl synthase n=1 Tax=Ephemerocybe angulata TaxID=980116 RepID=A0A8H6LYE7_9AGAR|nr:beta-ketoacyl synthase [Tulosesus angulatus]